MTHQNKDWSYMLVASTGMSKRCCNGASRRTITTRTTARAMTMFVTVLVFISSVFQDSSQGSGGKGILLVEGFLISKPCSSMVGQHRRLADLATIPTGYIYPPTIATNPRKQNPVSNLFVVKTTSPPTDATTTTTTVTSSSKSRQINVVASQSITMKKVPSVRPTTTSEALSSPAVTTAVAVRSQPSVPTSAQTLQMLSFYHIHPIENPSKLRDDLFEQIRHIPGLRGTIYITPEGIDAQVGVPPPSDDDAYIDMVDSSPLSLFFNACYSTDPDLFSFLVCTTTTNAANGNKILTKPLHYGDIVPVDKATMTLDQIIVAVRDEVGFATE